MSLEFDDHIKLATLSSHDVGDDDSNVYPIFDASDPLPAINRGYYFKGTSYMKSLNAITFSPYFTIFAWIKATAEGCVLYKKDGTTQYLKIFVDSNSFLVLMITLHDSTTLSVIAASNVLNAWHYIAVDGYIMAGGSTIIEVYIDSILLSQSISPTKSYFRDSMNGDLFIGFDDSISAGFSGYL